MCTNKLVIKNPVKEENRTGFDKLKLKVPCNSCKECLKQRSSDWLVRSYFEMQSFTGIPFFVTVTYDNEHLPSYNGKSCFDYNHVKAFFKRLRYYIGEFRYLLACEYGGFLHRPHYHFLLFPDKPILLKDFVKSVNQCWQYGYISKVSEVSSSAGFSRLEAVQYITGYCTKDVSFDSFTYNDNLPFRYRSRTQASKHFGAHEFSQEDFERGYVYLPLGTDGRSFKYAIPKYYYMRVFYDYNYDPKTRKSSLHKNAKGVELSKLQHNRCYVYSVNSVFASKDIDINQVVRLSPVLYDEFGSWRSCVYFLFEDVDDFCEYMYLRPFLHFHRPDGRLSSSFDGKNLIHEFEVPFSDSAYSYNLKRILNYSYKITLSSKFNFDIVIDTLHRERLYRPRWFKYEDIMQVFDEYNAVLGLSKTEAGKQELLEGARRQAINKLKKNPQLFNYLRYVVDYDFEKNLGIKV